jgi:hypothetical protein
VIKEGDIGEKVFLFGTNFGILIEEGPTDYSGTKKISAMSTFTYI